MQTEKELDVQMRRACSLILDHKPAHEYQDMFADRVGDTCGTFAGFDHPELWRVILAANGWKEATTISPLLVPHLTTCPPAFKGLHKWATANGHDVFVLESPVIKNRLNFDTKSLSRAPKRRWNPWREARIWNQATHAVAGVLVVERTRVPLEERSVVGALLFNRKFQPVFRSGDLVLPRTARVPVEALYRNRSGRVWSKWLEWKVPTWPEDNQAWVTKAWRSNWLPAHTDNPDVESLFDRLRGDPLLKLEPPVIP